MIEAALFVGGGPLTTRKLCSLLRGDAEADDVERAISELNDRYADLPDDTSDFGSCPSRTAVASLSRLIA